MTPAVFIHKYQKYNKLINKDARARVIMMTSYFIPERERERELNILRLGRDFGNEKLYSDNIGSACSISLFSGAFSVHV